MGEIGPERVRGKLEHVEFGVYMHDGDGTRKKKWGLVCFDLLHGDAALF